MSTHEVGRPQDVPTWVISLASATDRRHRMAERMRVAGMAFEFSDAVDGEALTSAELATLYDPHRAIAATNAQLTLGQIATSLSHQALYRRMLREHVPEALILEDDAVPTPDLGSILEARERFPAGWDVVLLYHGRARSRLWGRHRLIPTHTLRRYVTFTPGAVGYLIRERAARRLLEMGAPVHVPADYLLGGWTGPSLRVYGVEPCCITHEEGPSMRVTPSRERMPALDLRPELVRTPPRGRTRLRRGLDILRLVDPRDPVRTAERQ